jgi:hypothetical protein
MYLYLVCSTMFAQPSYVKYYGAGATDRCYSITTNGTDVVQVGTSRGYAPVPNDVYWIRTNQVGTILNSYYVSLGGDDCANSVQYDANTDRYITTGYSTNRDSDSTCSRNVFLLASTNIGIPIWSMKYGARYCEDVGQSVIVTSDKFYVVAGYTTYQCDSDSISCNSHNVLLFKTTSNGTLVWSKSIDIVEGDDYGMKVIEASNGDYYVAGYSGVDNAEPFLMDVSSSGNVNWVGFYGSDYDDKAFSLVEDKKGIAVVGHTSGFNSAGSPDILVFKTDYTGLELWKAEYNTTYNTKSSFGRDIISYGDYYYITGYADDISSASRYDVDFLVIDKNGVKQTESNIGGNDDDRGYALVATNNGFKITGNSYTWSNGLDDAIQINVQNNGRVGNCSVEDPEPEQYISSSIFPYFSSCDYNYSDTDSVFYRDAIYQRVACGSDSDTLPHRMGRFEYENSFTLKNNVIHNDESLDLLITSALSAQCVITIYNLEGKLLKTSKSQISIGSTVLQIDGNDFMSGLYFIRISYNRFSCSEKFIKLE